MVVGAIAGEVATSLIRLSVADVGFAVPMDAVATVMAASQVVRDDPGDDLLVGHVPSRFGAIPVADAARLFGLEADRAHPGASQRLIVLHGTPPLGLLVDEVETSSRSATDACFPLSPLCGDRSRLLVDGVAWNEGGTFDLLIDLPALREAVLGNESEAAAYPGGDAPILPILHDNGSGQVLDVVVGALATRLTIPLAAIRHIDDFRQPSPLPRAHPAILGLLSWRQHPIPLIDPCEVIGIEPATPGRLIVVGAPGTVLCAPDDVVCALAVRDISGITVS